MNGATWHVHKIKGANSSLTQYHEEVVFRLKQLADIKSQFGYGEFIHNFKNYVLRGQQKYVDRFKQNQTIMFEAINNLKQLSLVPEEKEAIKKIEGVAREYVKNINLAAQLVSQGKTPTEIDHAVKINDSPAFQGFKVIEKTIRSLELASSSSMQKNKKSLSYVIIISLSSFVIIFLLMGCFYEHYQTNIKGYPNG